ncbi:SGNH/GDSL hydrolase family protein [Moorena sp. SIO3I6]|uniref:SGNH/GDSL hydrolase family protein n=1 Tax=Moorena sp. SIO3I6 TaxID=2607831 RepID=UPI0013F71FC4|nr:SGNH/GDSL hydrolase family protein [Moorena sp. SIO3I6]NEP22765.1 SGNH/GDSL hydrolase family protein [Moorena sp. SIO3I6]
MKTQIAATGLVFFSLMLPLRANAVELFSKMYIFGDSLSDQGNLFNATVERIPPSPPYFEGRFSNGPNWVDYLAGDLELNPTLFTTLGSGAIPTEGINFAFGGSTTGTVQTAPVPFSGLEVLPGLQPQIDAFTVPLIQAGQSADPDALYIVWAGANDYLPNQGTFEPFTETDTTLANLSDALQDLTDVGAKTIMVVNLPDLGNTPIALGVDGRVPGTTDALNTLIEDHNSGLSELLDQFSQTADSDVNIIPLDVNSIFKEILAQPKEFGFTNVTTPCLNIPAQFVCENPEEFLFWDLQHPTTGVYRIIADLALSALNDPHPDNNHPHPANNHPHPTNVPEPAMALGLFALGALGIGSKRIGKRGSGI